MWDEIILKVVTVERNFFFRIKEKKFICETTFSVFTSLMTDFNYFV